MVVNKTAHFWTRRCLTFQTSKRLVSGIWWVSISQSYTKSRQNITTHETTISHHSCVQQQNEWLAEDESALFNCPNYNECFAVMCCYYQHAFLWLFFLGLVQSSQPRRLTIHVYHTLYWTVGADLPYQTLISCSTRFTYNHPLCKHGRMNGSFYKRNAFSTVPVDVHSEPAKWA